MAIRRTTKLTVAMERSGIAVRCSDLLCESLRIELICLIIYFYRFNIDIFLYSKKSHSISLFHHI